MLAMGPLGGEEHEERRNIDDRNEAEAIQGGYLSTYSSLSAHPRKPQRRGTPGEKKEDKSIRNRRRGIPPVKKGALVGVGGVRYKQGLNHTGAEESRAP